MILPEKGPCVFLLQRSAKERKDPRDFFLQKAQLMTVFSLERSDTPSQAEQQMRTAVLCL